MEEKKTQVLLGDEAVALGSVHAGITAAYAYPGTPSTEIVEFLIAHYKRHGAPRAAWAANEKTALEAGLGVSFVGRRALVAMKHVGLNVAADPFMNSAVVRLKGGLVLAVADDPGMHSSQNEQDTRYFADFAHTICLEPADPQEIYDMTLAAYEISERFNLPVVLRLVTRLAHSRAVVRLAAPQPEPPLSGAGDPREWVLLPLHARQQWKRVLGQAPDVDSWSNQCDFNTLTLASPRLGVITAGNARNYYLENASELDEAPSHLHVGAYPMPVEKIRALAAHVDEILVCEDGYPFIERALKGVLPQREVCITGRLSGALPRDGELSSDLLRVALGLEILGDASLNVLDQTPGRPPQLCKGCPHIDTFAALAQARAAFPQSVVTADIGCSTLGALPPYHAIESCVCMGASVGMAKGAAEAGLRPAVGLIGDSTFCHSGITALLDVVADQTPMTLIIVDNETTAMTGGQPTIVPYGKLERLVLGTGIDPEHCRVVKTHPRSQAALAKVLESEMAYDGPSVVIAVRECIETAKKKPKAKK